MRRFLASAWFPFLTCLVMGGVTLAAVAVFKETGDGVGNGSIVEIFSNVVRWAIGPAMSLISLIIIGILNIGRRVIGVRRIGLLHPVMVLAGTMPWTVFSWVLLDEPRYTPIFRAMIDFLGRPMLWGSLAATLFAILLSLPLLFPSQKK